MPEARQDTCLGDYSNTKYSWNLVLKPFVRAPDQPKSTVDVAYEPVSGNPDTYYRSFQAIRFLETLAALAADRYLLPRTAIAAQPRPSGRSSGGNPPGLP
jgi:hypothetical protein